MRNSIIICIIVIAVLAGYFAGKHSDDPVMHNMPSAAVSPEKPGTLWTCSMHPNIKLPHPGKCPICFMDLIPLKEDATPLADNELKLSDSAQKRAEIETVKVKRKSIKNTITLPGTIDFDETAVSKISAWVSGRIDRIYVDYTGIPIKKGDHIADLYSPELYSAQQELIEAAKLFSAATNQMLKNSAGSTLQSARQKLSLLGLTGSQIQQIENSSTPLTHLTVYSPVSGIVIHKNADAGMYVNTGMPLYTVADMSSLWIIAEAYESDLAWIRYGQKMKFTTPAWPGETFHATVSFIDPVLNTTTRTVKIRANVDNSDGRLKPGMFVTALISSTISSSLKIIDPEIAGKYICPMHPEIISDSPGICSKCEMPLETAETLGYIKSNDSESPLVIPYTAPLITGRRAIVYIKEKDPGVFEAREITLGPRIQDWYIVSSGLSEGEEVVYKGAFKIDSTLQIHAGKSFMTLPDDMPRTTTATYSEKELSILRELFEEYCIIQKDLRSDIFPSNFPAFVKIFEKPLPEDSSLHKALQQIKISVLDMQYAENLQAIRIPFKSLSDSLYPLIKNANIHAFWHFCPMAFNNTGAFWLDTDKETLNPYFGAAMLHCGEIRDSW